MTKNIEEKLTELFIKWKERQKGNPDEYNWEKTGIAVSSFTKDGIVNENTWNKLEKQGKKRVLYLLREANGNSSELGQMGRVVDDGEFWFGNCVESGCLGNRIFSRIADMQKVIQGEFPSSNQDALMQVAYMNINKRGGGAAVDWKILNRYAKEYATEIKNEICLIRPDEIVCCGTYWVLVDIICGFYGEKDNPKWQPDDKEDFCLEATIESDNYKECKVKIINMYHPSARMSDEKYIERFRNIYSSVSVAEKMKSDGILMKKEEICTIIDKMNPQSEEYFELCEFLSNVKAVN